MAEQRKKRAASPDPGSSANRKGTISKSGQAKRNTGTRSARKENISHMDVGQDGRGMYLAGFRYWYER